MFEHVFSTCSTCLGPHCVSSRGKDSFPRMLGAARSKRPPSRVPRHGSLACELALYRYGSALAAFAPARPSAARLRLSESGRYRLDGYQRQASSSTRPNTFSLSARHVSLPLIARHGRYLPVGPIRMLLGNFVCTARHTRYSALREKCLPFATDRLVHKMTVNIQSSLSLDANVYPFNVCPDLLLTTSLTQV